MKEIHVILIFIIYMHDLVDLLHLMNFIIIHVICIKFLSLLGAGDCIFTFLAIHAISRSKRYGGEESQDFPENPYLLHCSHHKVHSPFGKLYNLICIKDE